MELVNRSKAGKRTDLRLGREQLTHCKTQEKHSNCPRSQNLWNVEKLTQIGHFKLGVMMLGVVLFMTFHGQSYLKPFFASKDVWGRFSSKTAQDNGSSCKSVFATDSR